MEKLIHYCWFGSKEIPESDKKCIESWNKYLPDYKIMLWNEKSFNIDAHPFAKQAYEAKKYAFVSDYVRVYALYMYGGIYFDTDYLLIKDINPIIETGAILGCENSHFVGTAIMIAEKGNWLMKEMIDYYDSVDFQMQNGDINAIPNTMILTDILENKGFVRGKSWSCDDVKVYERSVFFPKKLEENKFDIRDETVGIHYFNGSWWSEKERKRSNSKIYNKLVRPLLRGVKKFLRVVIGKSYARNIENIVKNRMR